jgi:hypothetical protein
MRQLLQKAITQIEKLPPDEQDAIAERILADLADEEEWSRLFSATTDEQWDRLAEAVRRDATEGRLASMDEVFPKSEPTFSLEIIVAEHEDK